MGLSLPVGKLTTHTPFVQSTACTISLIRTLSDVYPYYIYFYFSASRKDGQVD